MTRLTAWCLRIAGANGIVNGLGFGGFAIPAIVSVGQGHGIIYTFGNPTYGNGPFEQIGVPTTVPLLAGFLAACAVQVVGGVLLLWPRPSGIVVSVVGILLGAPFWWGFNLPFAWLNAAVVLTFLILAWTAQKGSSRSPQVARWIRTFPAPGANGQSPDHVWWIVLAVCAVAIAISAGGRSRHVSQQGGKMTNHPNFDRAQAMLDATRRGDYAPAFGNFADDIVMENGPGAGPWHRARGKDDLALMLLELAGSFGDTFTKTAGAGMPMTAYPSR